MMPIQNNDQYIGQILLEDGVITTEDLKRGLIEQKKNRDFLCTTLVKLGFASEEKIFSILSLQLGVPYLNLKDVQVDTAVVNRIPGSLALACKCLPLKVVEDIFFIAMTDPLNTQTVDEIKGYVGVEKFKIFLAGDNDLRDSIKKYYGL